jgi:diguanylate cyclase (GGDEF)-like protein/PAS domain S-box-containing protein/putative nucleotidyltransferase with HDIG domain
MFKDETPVELALKESEDKFKSLYSAMSQGVAFCQVVLDDAGMPVNFVLLDMNDSFTRITGVTPEMAVGRQVTDLMPNMASWIDEFGKVALTGVPCYHESSLSRAGKHFSIFAYCPKKYQFVVLLTDISNQIAREEQLDELDIFFNIIPDLLCVIRSDGCFLKVNPAWSKVLGYNADEVEGQSFTKFIHPDDETRDRQVLREAQESTSQSRILNHVNRYHHKDGSYHFLEWNLQKYGDKYYGIARDITLRKLYEEKIEFLSYHDVMTGLFNRRFLEEEIKRVNTARNLPISIIMGDVNQLKLVNDAFGHEKGDELIKKAANAIMKGCRSEDLVARWGGDEFLICLPRTDTSEAVTIVNRILDLCADEEVNAIPVSISFGIGTKASMDEEIMETLRMAEEAMYIRKALDRKSVRGDVLNAVTSVFYHREPAEEKHANDVSALCRKMAKVLGLDPEEVNKLALGGLMHDIGKIAISTQILEKPEALSEAEWVEMRQHPEVGQRVISSVQDMVEVGNAILSHHERWNGNGYPNGIKWEEIPLFSRIIALADSYSTMTSVKTYRPKLSRDEAIAEIRRNEGSQFDPELAEIFIQKVLNFDQ